VQPKAGHQVTPVRNRKQLSSGPDKPEKLFPAHDAGEAVESLPGIPELRFQPLGSMVQGIMDAMRPVMFVPAANKHLDLVSRCASDFGRG
jgi:hypothetical protein